MMYNNKKFLERMFKIHELDVDRLLISPLWATIESSKLPKERHEEVFEAILGAFSQEDICLHAEHLDEAFIWADTIQGGDYWNNIEDLMEGDYFDGYIRLQ